MIELKEEHKQLLAGIAERGVIGESEEKELKSIFEPKIDDIDYLKGFAEREKKRREKFTK